MERAKSHLDGSHRQTFGNRSGWKKVFEVKQTIHQLQLAAESNACHFCFLRWEHLCDRTDASQRSLAANDAYEADVRWRDKKPEAWNVTLLYEVGGFQSMSRFKFQSEVKRKFAFSRKAFPALYRRIQCSLRAVLVWLITCLCRKPKTHSQTKPSRQQGQYDAKSVT
jgi:hypothetical protein